MNFTFEVDLMDKRSIANAVKELRQYKNDFRVRLDKFARKLAELGVQEAQIHIRAWDAIDDGTLINSIGVNVGKSYGSKVKYYVVANCDYACFVEFGTGSVGANAPYPFPFPKGVKWKYGVGKKIFTTKDGRRGWVYMDKDGDFWFTEGMEARPFMAQASLALFDQVERVAKEVFG